jgi:hypothetical protein
MRMIAVCLVSLICVRAAGAADPVLPPPTLVEPELLPPLGYYRISAYEVWQNRAVDRRGYFAARVIMTPYGLVYRYNGQPYLTPTAKQMDYMPYASD